MKAEKKMARCDGTVQFEGMLRRITAKEPLKWKSDFSAAFFGSLFIDIAFNLYFERKGLFRYQVFLHRAFILEQSSLDEMKGI